MIVENLKVRCVQVQCVWNGRKWKIFDSSCPQFVTSPSNFTEKGFELASLVCVVALELQACLLVWCYLDLKLINICFFFPPGARKGRPHRVRSQSR